MLAGQMLNLGLTGGWSVHLLGGSAAAVLLGLPGSVVAMAAVLLVQCLLFADGSWASLGANLVNMGVLAPVLGWAAWSASAGLGRPIRSLAVGLGSAAGVLFAAAACGAELALSHASAAGAWAALLSTHWPLALGEGALTAAVAWAATGPQPVQLWRWGWALAAVLLAAVPWASALPDALETVLESLALAGDPAPGWAQLADYQVPGVGPAGLSTVLAGAVGVGLLWALAAGLGRARTIAAAARPPRPTRTR
jgi:cobalt/nickel transport system permease protein